MKQGFTLLELLIVIAIIGLLASVVMVSFPEAQRRARIAQAQQFAESLRASLQYDMVGWWAFDESSGSTAKDSWFTQNHGTVSGAQWVEGIANNALYFDGTDDYVEIAPVNPSKITIEMWVKKSNDSEMAALNFFQDSCHFFQFLGRGNIDPKRVKVYLRTTCGHSPWMWESNKALAAGEWYHLALTNDGTVVRLFINGKLDFAMPDGGANLSQIDPTVGSIGSGMYDLAHESFFSGLIDEVRIYEAALPQSAIQQYYAEGLKTHQNLAIFR